jgi:hypothetical protein
MDSLIRRTTEHNKEKYNGISYINWRTWDFAEDMSFSTKFERYDRKVG